MKTYLYSVAVGLNEIKGDASKEKYCAALVSIVKRNNLGEGAMEKARYGYDKHFR